jgi:hypothetical protein
MLKQAAYTRIDKRGLLSSACTVAYAALSVAGYHSTLAAPTKIVFVTNAVTEENLTLRY